jgi:nucleoside phosphorylase
VIAITFALPVESAGLRRLLKNRSRVGVDEKVSLQGELHGKRVTILHTGVGGKVCRERLRVFLEADSIASLISAGFAGAVIENLRVGDLFVAENFTNPDLITRSRQVLAAARPHFGRLTTVPTIIDAASERTKLRASTGAMAVDMETEFIAQACAEREIPFFSLRAISDTPAEPFPAPPQILFNLESQRVQPAIIALYLLQHPAAIGRLVRFARRINDARQKLTSAIDALIASDLF